MPTAGGRPAASPRGGALRGGIDVGGTKIQAVVVDARGTVRGQDRQATPLTRGPRGVVAAMAAALRGAARAAGVEAAQLAGVGVGCPGAIDAVKGTVAEPPNLPWKTAYPIGPELSKTLGAPVFVDNDVRVATRAEVELGAGRDFDSLLGVFWGTGVGGGIVLNRTIWHGRGAAGEIGHTIIRRGGALCRCGRRGHVEAYAGRAAMEVRARRRIAHGTKSVLLPIMQERGIDRMTSGVWARALEHGDKLANHLVDRAVEALSTGIASACTLLDVEAVIIGGGLGVRLGQPYVDRIAARVGPQVFLRERPPQVLLAALGDLGGAIGASLLVGAQAAKPRPR
ncbi:MAG TPA: ROK family protein [Candidatus Angelobacter sp.]|jgi:glucokinase|nr:ROK family protein [Candidatus Angelobacter sp.]